MNTQEEIKPGTVRKDLYDYLEGEGLKITDVRHKAIKTAIVMHTNATTEELRRETNNAKNALGNMKAGPKIQTIIDRIAKKQCAACGLNLTEVKPHEYVAGCGHYPTGVKIIIG